LDVGSFNPNQFKYVLNLLPYLFNLSSVAFEGTKNLSGKSWKKFKSINFIHKPIHFLLVFVH